MNNVGCVQGSMVPPWGQQRPGTRDTSSIFQWSLSMVRIINNINNRLLDTSFYTILLSIVLRISEFLNVQEISPQLLQKLIKASRSGLLVS